MYKLILNTKLPTLNEFISDCKIIRKVGKKVIYNKANDVKQSTEDIIIYLAKQLNFTLPKGVKFYMAYEWYNYNRCDDSNVRFAEKFILDALQKADILVNDNQKHLHNSMFSIHLKDKKHPSQYQNVLFFTDKEEFINYITKNIK